jgi:amino acid adenylation domain-containing protein/non-ribosomal peptide synthase protein (TIGR01720 family)
MPEPRNKYCCGLIGQSALLIGCGKTLLMQGHSIGLVSSADPAVQEWAGGSTLPWIDMGTQENLAIRLKQAGVDYLFSIANPCILGEQVLRSPRRMAINYHDALLPRYAGSHATSWAILNGETIHGITWHVMSSSVDCGDILRQVKLDVADDETAMTLNVKCFDAALRSFDGLLADLERGTAIPQAQDPTQRTFFSRHRRPLGAGIIDWNLPAQQIDRFARALNFGSCHNPLGLPKLLVNGSLFVPENIEVLDRHAVPPGTVIAVEPHGLSVAAADRVVRVSRLRTLAGASIQLDVWAKEHNIRPGVCLQTLDNASVSNISAFDKRLAAEEEFWSECLGQIRPLALPYSRNIPSEDSVAKTVPLPAADKARGLPLHVMQTMTFPAELWKNPFSPGCRGNTREHFLATFLGYCVSLSDDDEFDVGLCVPQPELPALQFGACFSGLVPHRVKANALQPVMQVLEELKTQLQQTQSRRTFPCDMVSRYPTLAQVPELQLARPFSVALCCASNPDTIRTGGRELTVVVTEDSRHCWWLHDPASLHARDVARMMEQFLEFSRSATADGARALGLVPIQSATQERQLTVEWNQSVCSYPIKRGLHQFFEERAVESPKALAVKCGPRSRTYSELNVRADRAAANLAAAGISRGSRVVLYTGRSIEAIEAIFGILKAGAAYVPLDPLTPIQRAVTIAVQTQPQAIVADRDRLPSALELNRRLQRNIPVFCMDHGFPGDEFKNLHAPLPADAPKLTWPATAEDLAYVIFTSGSTGTPKGVEVRHRAALNTLDWVNRTFGVGAGDTLLSVSSFAFDLSVYDILGTLAAGGTLYLADDEEVRDPRRLVEIIRSEPITFWNSAPAALQQLTSLFPDAPQCLSEKLRLVFLSGDWVPLALPGLLVSRFPNTQVVALGGATEAAIWSNWFVVQDLDPRWTSIPYGRPIQNSRYYILDRWLRARPVGIEGDLYIAGDCLADGYINAPELTAERFVPDPFARPGERMYRTGDRARYMDDGNIEFRGRRDGQVKIRGFRVELGEIEAALHTHPGVRQAVVLAQRIAGHGVRLEAYIVAQKGTAPSTAELREHLGRLLPQHMIPNILVQRQDIPLTPNGKVDRRALQHERIEPGGVGEPPATELEERIAAIWRRVLGAGHVSRQDNFFELGGDSLMSVEVVARAAAAGLELSPQHLFQCPTVAQLAQVAKPLQPKPRPLLSVCDTRDELPLTPIQHWLFNRNLCDPQNYNIVFTLDVDPGVNPLRLMTAIESVATQHDAFALRFDRIGDRWRQRLAKHSVHCELVDLQSVAASQRSAAMQAALFDLRRSLDLCNGPLLKAVVFDLGAERKLGVVVHHLIFDGASRRIWIEQIEAACQHEFDSAPRTLKAVGFGDWARLMSMYAKTVGGDYVGQWLEMPWSRVRPLPLDFPGGLNTYASSAIVEHWLEPSETRALLHQASSRYGVSSGEVFLAAWGRAATAWADSPATCVDVTGHGRDRFLEDIDVSGTIGYVTTISPAVLQSDQLVPTARPHEHTWGMLRYLCRSPRIARHLADLPVAQVKFNFQGYAAQGGPQRLLRGPLALPVRGALHRDNPRAYALNIELAVIDGRLNCQCVYSNQLHRRERIESLLEGFAGELCRVAIQSRQDSIVMA